MRRRLAYIGAALLALVSLGPYLVPLPPQPDLDAESIAPPGVRFLTVDGVRTAIETSGPDDGPAVVLVHGFGGSTFSWRYTLPVLAEAGYRAVAVDLKGFGLSAKTYAADYTHTAQAEFVGHTLDALGLEHATLIGHSLGGNVIAHFAMQYPERVDGLVFVDAAIVEQGGGWGLGSLAVFPPFRRVGQILMRALLTPEAVTDRLRTAYYDPNFVTPEVAEGYLRPQTVTDWDLALLGIVRDSRRNELPQPLSTLSAPALIVWGENDRWTPLARGEAMRAALPHAEWTVFPRAGHLPMEEQAASFNERLLEFLHGRQ